MSQHVIDRARALMGFLDGGPSPWHAVANAVALLEQHGFRPLEETRAWSLAPGDAHYILRNGSSLVAFVVGSGDPAEHGLRLVGAHTDSPTLRLKPRPADAVEGMLRLAVDVYGGPVLATFVDRDLDLAGRVFVADPAGGEPRAHLLRFNRSVVRVPGLAIHMDREVNTTGLVLDRQKHLPLLAGLLPPGRDPRRAFLEILGDALG